jgi:hypothetical protein
MIFDIKMDFTRNALLVAGGRITDPPSCLTYSSVVSRESVGIAFLIAAVNGYEIIAADVQNSYVQEKSLERYFAIEGDEFGGDKGKKALIVRAIWFKKFGSKLVSPYCPYFDRHLLFPSHGDPDVWMCMDFNQTTNASYWEYLLVYVDYLLAIGLDPRATLNTLETDYNYVLKDFGPPTRYLGASIGTYNLDDTMT